VVRDNDYDIFSPRFTFAPDGKRFAWNEGGKIHVVDVISGKEALTLKGEGGPLAFAPAGDRLALCCRDGTVLLWDLPREPVRKAKDDGDPSFRRSRKFDGYGKIARIDKASVNDKKKGVLVTITIDGYGVPAQFTQDTELEVARGKLVETGMVDDLQVGDWISVWFKSRPGTFENQPRPAERVMLFRTGDPRALPGG
jgi:WD40 repeat protein